MRGGNPPGGTTGDWLGRDGRLPGCIPQAWRGGKLPPTGLPGSLGAHFHGSGVYPANRDARARVTKVESVN